MTSGATRWVIATAVAGIGMIGTVSFLARGHHSSVSAANLDPERNERKGGPDLDNPLAAFLWRRQAMLDEHGRIAPGSWARAVSEKHALAASRPHADVAGDEWVELGPTNVSGRSCALVTDPKNPLILYMGAAGGGVWKSINQGVSWTPIGDSMESLAVNALAMDPNNSKVLYAGTGEGYFNIDAIEGFGIYKSTDGGSTWQHLINTAGWTHVNRIAVDPSNSNNVLATIQYGGIERSTDGGNTWNSVHWAQDGEGLQFCAANPSQVVATVLDYDFTNSRWFLSVMTSADSGATWTAANGAMGYTAGFGRFEATYLPGSSSTVYVSANCSGGPNNDGYLWKSTDGGTNFTRVTTTNEGTTADWYRNDIWIDPTDTNRIIVAGVPVWGSTNGGTSFNVIGEGYIQTAQPHPDSHHFAPVSNYNGTTNTALFVTTDGGTYVAPDIATASSSQGWTNLDQTSRTTQFYAIAANGTANEVVGGTQDNGTLAIYVGNPAASLTYGGDGGYVAIDPSNANYVFGEYVDLQVFRSTSGAFSSNATEIINGLTDAQDGDANFIAPMIMDPNNPEILYGGGASLWRCSNAEGAIPSWTSVLGSIGGDLISAIAVAPENSNHIYVGYNNGTVAMTTNGLDASPSWSVISGPNNSVSPLPNRMCTRIVVDPTTDDTVYATFGGFTTDNIWKSTDGGTTWNAITGTGSSVLPQVPIRALAIDPQSPSTLYIGTEIGIFSTADGGTTWSVTSDGPNNACVYDLEYMSGTENLFAGTHGRGIWELKHTPPYTVLPSSFAVDQGTLQSGSLTSLLRQGDGNVMYIESSANRQGQQSVAIETDFALPPNRGTVTSLSLTVAGSATSSETEELYMWDFVTAQWVLMGKFGASSEISATTEAAGGTISDYLSPTRTVRTLVEFVKGWSTKVAFQTRLDYVGLRVRS